MPRVTAGSSWHSAQVKTTRPTEVEAALPLAAWMPWIPWQFVQVGAKPEPLARRVPWMLPAKASRASVWQVPQVSAIRSRWTRDCGSSADHTPWVPWQLKQLIDASGQASPEAGPAWMLADSPVGTGAPVRPGRYSSAGWQARQPWSSRASQAASRAARPVRRSCPPWQATQVGPPSAW